MDKPIVIAPDLQLVGLWMSVAKLLSHYCRVVVVANGQGAKVKMQEVLGDANITFEVKEEFYRKSKFAASDDLQEIIAIARKMEQKYGEFCSMIIAHERGLGKGYLFNADGHPAVGKAWWTHERKIKEIIKEFMFWEYLFRTYYPVVVLTTLHTKTMSLVARYYKVLTLALWVVKYGDRQFFMEDEYYGNRVLLETVRTKVQEYLKNPEKRHILYAQETGSEYLNSIERYSFYVAFKKAFRVILRDIKQYSVGHYRKFPGSYHPFGWIPLIIRKPYMYRYFLKYGKRPDELKSYKIVFFPLHFEPEVALLTISPEMTNSLEAISWLSKSLPADAILVVKEHPNGFGTRRKQYYDHLRRMANVVLACPEVSSWDWIRNADLVATIAGTVGIEAVYFDKPVISFGKHQIINELPTVRYANNFDVTRLAVSELLALHKSAQNFWVSKAALYDGQMRVSFPLADLEKLYRSFAPEPEKAEVVVAALKKFYPAVF